MENNDIAIPYSCTFYILKISDFSAFDCSVKIDLKMALSIKLTDI